MEFTDKTFRNILKENKTVRDCYFDGCVFENCKFIDCVFADCVFSECKFIECSVVNLQPNNTSMAFSSFVKCQLIDIQWGKLQAGIISFPIEKLENCFLKYNVFDKMSFKKFNFNQSSVTESSFD